MECSYVITTFISGIPLYNIWFGNPLQSVYPDTTHSRRIRALESITWAMVQLDKLLFELAVVLSSETMATYLIAGLCDESITRLCLTDGSSRSGREL